MAVFSFSSVGLGLTNMLKYRIEEVLALKSGLKWTKIQRKS